MKRATKERGRQRDPRGMHPSIAYVKMDDPRPFGKRAAPHGGDGRTERRTRRSWLYFWLFGDDTVDLRYRRRDTCSARFPSRKLPLDTRARTLEWLAFLPNRKNHKCTFWIPVDGQPRNLDVLVEASRLPKARTHDGLMRLQLIAKEETAHGTSRVQIAKIQAAFLINYRESR